MMHNVAVPTLGSGHALIAENGMAAVTSLFASLPNGMRFAPLSPVGYGERARV